MMAQMKGLMHKNDVDDGDDDDNIDVGLNFDYFITLASAIFR